MNDQELFAAIADAKTLDIGIVLSPGTMRELIETTQIALFHIAPGHGAGYSFAGYPILIDPLEEAFRIVEMRCPYCRTRYAAFGGLCHKCGAPLPGWTYVET